ncbi:serine/threonine protein kinase [Amycolatopsis sp. K13G38]|uniref:non-specific serine/threonine protein kinase n=1 Tax=Amycolatopsis acididurans TaxID=2724524 RepID=A0ABX1JDK1_9PSEU|nr:serine/threonine protein kinase [Amycolatopsis acididurans]
MIAGRYRLRRRIGGGAMGVVWLADDELLGRTVAAKQLLLAPNLSERDAEQARKRSAREARLAARLQHHNAITVFDVPDDDGMPVLIMEYLPSQSLAEVLQARGRLPPREVARIGSHAAAALAAAHAAGIVHRDVKPGNILLGEDGTAKITDFGISRAADDGTLTGSGGFAGTPAFLAPEAARGEKPSAASDVYSLGATLYAIVEGRFPYGDTENQMALLYAAAAGRFSPPEHAGPLTDVLLRMMRFKPEERPTMAELAVELARLADPARHRRRRPLLYAGAGAVVLVAAIVAAVLLLTSNRGTQSLAVTGTPSPAPATTEPPSPVTTTTDSSSPAPPPSTAAAPSYSQAVSEYYALVPGQLDAGWARLGPALQAQGKGSYQSWWGQISNIVVTGAPHLVGDAVVEVTVDFTKNGTRYRETHHLGMITRDGQPLINTDKAVSSTIIG